MGLARRVAYGLLWPVRRLLNPRFEDIKRHIALTRQDLANTHHAVGTITGNVDQLIGSYAASGVEAIAAVGGQLRTIEAELEEIRTAAARRRLDALTQGRIEDIDQPAADLLNYAGSHRGFAAQSELWLNPPVVVEYAPGAVRVANITERIVEVPFAMQAIGTLARDSHVLDFGSAESTLALSMAALGYDVTALDLREYPFRHPRLRSVASPIESWAAAPGSYDAVLCVSTIEHIGLGWYGDPAGARGDLEAGRRIAELLRPGGLFVLTVPYGAPSVDALQRRYDRAGLDELLEGWDVIDRRVVERTDDCTWQEAEDSDGEAVALVVAHKPTG